MSSGKGLSTAAGRRLRDGYEALRSQALAGDGDGDCLGKGLLRQRGMAAWARAYGQEMAGEGEPPPAAGPRLSCAPTPPEVVEVLAAMILSCGKEAAT